MAEKTLFEKIIAGEIPGEFVHQDERCVVLHDIDPQAPVHLLVIPRKPIPRIAEAGAEDEPLLGHLLLVAARMAARLDLARGFRIVINSGPDGGESVPHLHVHVLGGRNLGWPPG
ncbi:MAG: histidine triad nucleotide-binding protein [Puniceicoccaceae bacterium]